MSGHSYPFDPKWDAASVGDCDNGCGRCEQLWAVRRGKYAAHFCRTCVIENDCSPLSVQQTEAPEPKTLMSSEAGDTPPAPPRPKRPKKAKAPKGMRRPRL
jgi:hypothetical protein